MTFFLIFNKTTATRLLCKITIMNQSVVVYRGKDTIFRKQIRTFRKRLLDCQNKRCKIPGIISYSYGENEEKDVVFLETIFSIL